MKKSVTALSVVVAATMLMPGSIVPVGAADDFYAGKQIRLVAGFASGSSYDFSARMISRHLERHIPGEPRVVVVNMPGAGSIAAANFINNVAPQDGSVIGAVLQNLPHSQLFGDGSARFDSAQFQWIGNPTASVNVFVTWHRSGVTSLEQVFRQTTILGATSRASSGGIDIALANNILGTKFQMVAGYKGGNEIDIAMERGEVAGNAGRAWSGWKATKPEWVENRKLNVLIQVGPHRSTELQDVPLMTELAKTPEDRMILQLNSDAIAIGKPLLVGKDVPAKRVAILREAFRQVMRDPLFLKEAAATGFDVTPVYGEDLQAIVARMIATPPSLLQRAKEAMAYHN